MIRINLLPVRAQIRKAYVREFLYAYALSVLLTLATVAYLWVSQGFELSRQENRLQSVKKEVENYAKYDKILSDLQAKKETIENKRKVIGELQRDRDRLVRVLALLSVQVPVDRVWFEKFSQSGNTLSIEGVALSNETIAEFMRNMESSPYVDRGSVNLVHSRLTTVGGMKLREFRLTCNVVPFSVVQQKLNPKQS
jgi:type IV pilus assembly protein PilN